MASITPRTNKNGEIISYCIRVSNGRGMKPYTTTFPENREPIPATWSKRIIEREVKKYAAAFEAKCRRGGISTERKTFSEYAEYVLDMKEQNGTKHSSLNRYRQSMARINDDSLNGIGNMKLSEIKPEHLNRFYSTLGKKGKTKQSGKPLSARTIFEYHAFIRNVLTQAYKEGKVPYNAAQRATPPKKQKHESECFEVDEIESIMEALESEPLEWKAIAHLFLFTGARRGEIMGLQWKNVDFDKNDIYLCNNLQWSKERGVYSETLKTGENRHVSIGHDVVSILRTWKAEQAKQQLQMGASWKNADGYVFTNRAGKEMNPDTVTKWFIRFSERHGLPHITPHKFRHTQASLLINAGMDIATVSKRLGHKEISTTLNVYSHIMAKADERAADMIERIIYKKNAK